MIDIGDTIGGYRILSLIGTGGMGKVFEAEHAVTKRIEALKVLLPAGDGTPDQHQEHISRFLREIQVQASLTHPNIATVHNAFDHDGVLVMVMELVRGSSLKRLLEIEGPPILKAIDLMCQVLDALDFAHRRGVVHRDITPANIIISSDGVVKLTDFGLAKSQRDVQLTREGIAVGSVHYMSPEQVRGQQELDNRSDLYSAGAVLYEMLCRQRVFDATDGFAIMRAHVEKQPIPPAQYNKEIPQSLNDLVLRALAKDPIQRFRAAGEFKQGLERCKAEIEKAKQARAEARRQHKESKEQDAAVSQVRSTEEKPKESPAPVPTRKLAMVVTAAIAGLALASFAFLATQNYSPVEAEQAEAAEPEIPSVPAKRGDVKKSTAAVQTKKAPATAQATRKAPPVKRPKRIVVQADEPEWAQPAQPAPLQKPVVVGLEPGR